MNARKLETSRVVAQFIDDIERDCFPPHIFKGAAMQEGRITAEAGDARELSRVVNRGQSSRPMLTIEPLDGDDTPNYMRDAEPLPPGVKLRARPTTRFLISWSGWNENFQREVNSVAELNTVIAPILAEHALGRKIVLKYRAALNRKAKQANAASLRKRLQMLKGEIAGVEAALAEQA